jgi:peptidoglycan L-alanyl-D-glutamate endopeptidase CwlK
MIMFHFGSRSALCLGTCDNRLVHIFHAAIDTGLIDISILEGRRGKVLQDEYFAAGRSKVQWPDSKHNVIDPDDLSKAVDAAPFVSGKVSFDKGHCIFMAGVVLACAARMGIRVRWGGNWDMDGEPITDQDFNDLVHFELID